MTTQHVSDLTWDRLHASQLSPALAEQAQRHAATCVRCAARRAALEAAHLRFVAAPPAMPAIPAATAASRARRALCAWRLIVPALAAAAIAILVLRVRVDPRHDRARIKGGFAVTAFAGRGGDAVPLGLGDPVFPGDRMQLSYSAPRAGHLAALAIDGAGHVEVYFPPDAAMTWPAAAGHRIALPTSTELDEVLGEERLWVAF